ncbi:4-trimethylaminobutyraldehyde dehydrogenase-like [Haliotis rubra]|uniref:4-trimethylaminobutyraldehyde dehydrogenase-like n=1 Tax=Haliotis rubra TaxID=36100 RepID=UPI001EE5F7CD|nr:4-trimethylaminobutyraldehyde dehydrogenase-like [Haliotis rubra]XP_046555609.1 4-trimethylaminobutyraldehyde dehydrogenase-like [Haliotis rubra]
MRLRVSGQIYTCLRRRYTTVTGSAAQVQQPLNYVNGQRDQPQGRDQASRFDLINPATGEVLRQVQNSGVEEVDGAIRAAQQALPSWSRQSGFDRGQVLRKAAQLIRERCEELARTEVLDTGKPIWEARYDIQGCADTIDYYGGLAAAITGEFTQLAGGSFAYTIREALGVVGAIGAWNYPFQMAAWKSSPALACGNTVVFKPSPFTPLTAVMLGEIYREAGLLDGGYNVIQGEGETGQLLCRHPGVAKMSFTGSVPTGSRIMEACAQDIKYVTLELGGKSPLIIFSDADIDNAVKGAMLANFSNQGQVCSNGTRVFVQKDVAQQFLEKLVERTRKMKIGDPNAEDTTVGATISSSQADKVMAYVEGAKKEGATVVYGGERVSVSDPWLAGGHYLSPCILADCHDDMTVVREEVFGSVMSVLTFDTEEEVLRRANDTEFGLAGGVFTRDLSRAHRVAAGMEAGSLYVNNYNIYPVGVPFGGYKKSGIGRENGRDTLDYYSQIKSVYVEMNDVDCPY